MHAVDCGTVEIARSRLLCRFSGVSRAATPRIEECCDLDAGIGKIERGAEGLVAPSKDDGALSGSDAEAIDIGAHGAGQHDSGAVVVAEHDRPLDGAGGEHGALRHDAPEPQARLMLRRHRHVVIDPLDRGISPAIIDADDRGPSHDAAVGQAVELGLGSRHPFERGTPIDLAALGEDAAAQTEILIA